MGPADSHYVHGTNPAEQRRLSLLNELLNNASLEEIGLRGGERVLDVGSGLAQFARAMGRAVGPAGAVIGIERDHEQIEEAMRQARAAGEQSLVELRQGEALDLPLTDGEWGSFDVVHARFLLEHVPDPLEVVRGMVRASRPGGRIVLEDDDHDLLRLSPSAPATDRLWRAYIETYLRHGRDPFVGRNLVSLLHRAGAVPSRNRCLFFGACSGHDDFEPMVENFAGVLGGARETLRHADLASDDEIDAALEELRAWSRRPDSALWYVTCWAEGARPEDDG